MSKIKWFVINDLDEFILNARQIIYNNFGKWNDDCDENDLINQLNQTPSNYEDFESVLSQQESTSIIKQLLRKQRNKNTQEIRYLISDDIFFNIMCQLNDRIVSNTISGLVKRGLLESAYDENIDDFIFWVKENELPETD